MGARHWPKRRDRNDDRKPFLPTADHGSSLVKLNYRYSLKQVRPHMKKLNLATCSLAAVMLFSPTVLRAGILGSPHDFSGKSWNIAPDDRNSVCGPCHQPHHASSTIIPLWGHTTSQGPWTMYSSLNSPTFKAAQSPTPTGTSLACLSCHDGTVAVNSYAGGIQGGSAVTLTNRARIGTDLTHTHPISFTYGPELVGTLPNQDQFLYNPDTQQVLQPDNSPFIPGNNMSINNFLLNGSHRLECNSCHEVHNQVGSPYDAINNPHLVKINGTQGGKGSLLCRSCHNK